MLLTAKVFEPHLHQALRLCPGSVQLLSQTVSLHTELGYLGPEGSHRLVQTHLNTEEEKLSHCPEGSPHTRHTRAVFSHPCLQAYSHVFLDRELILREVPKLLVFVLGKVQILDGPAHLCSALTETTVDSFQLLLAGQYGLHLLLMGALLFPGNDI